MITNEEARKAIEKYQEKHPLPFETMMDVTAISSKEGVDIISQTIEQISKKVEEDTELWCICEMAKMYMQGVRPVYPVRPQDKWIPVSERLPEDGEEVLTCRNDGFREIQSFEHGDYWENQNGDCTDVDEDEVIAWRPLPEPYKEEEEAENETY